MVDEPVAAGRSLAGQLPTDAQLAAWVEQFHHDGFLFLPSVLPPALTAELRADLDRSLTETPPKPGGVIELCERMFERSAANLRLFDLEPVVSFAEALIDGPCHVVHNNSFRTPPGGGITRWHQDDPPHYLVTEGEPPTNVRLPVLLFTANYYLTDVPTVAHGPTQTVRGSHLFGAAPPAALEGTKWADRLVSHLGPAGSVIMFNNQVWHRGAPNASETTRSMAQVSYARRLVGHKYYPFMNYQLPEHVTRGASPRLQRLLGFLPHGAYG